MLGALRTRLRCRGPGLARRALRVAAHPERQRRPGNRLRNDPDRTEAIDVRFNRDPARADAGEDGAILIFALLLITTVALVLTALMSSVDTNERATVSLRDVAA